MNQPIGACTAALLILLASTASAHHPEDPASGVPIEWTGKIQTVSWDGAHVMYRIDVENPQHQMERWQVLGASPKVLATRNISKDTLKAGDIVTFSGYLNPHNKIISPLHFTTPDGRKYAIGFTAK